MYGNAAQPHYHSVGGGGPAEAGDKSSPSCLSASCLQQIRFQEYSRGISSSMSRSFEAVKMLDLAWSGDITDLDKFWLKRPKPGDTQVNYNQRGAEQAGGWCSAPQINLVESHVSEEP